MDYAAPTVQIIESEEALLDDALGGGDAEHAFWLRVTEFCHAMPEDIGNQAYMRTMLAASAEQAV
jgi:hypothetical protein